MEELSRLPLTSYAAIDAKISGEGLDACLLAPAEHVFKTSGSTGSPKCMYYSRGDVDRIALDFGVVCRLAGVRPATSDGTWEAPRPTSRARCWR